jgi:hypothetical protein
MHGGTLARSREVGQRVFLKIILGASAAVVVMVAE